MPRSGSKNKSNMRDVARHAGVSVATVSRVLSGADKVARATRARVEASVETLRFVPSPSARAMNSGRTHMIGTLVPTLDHAIFARYLHALEEELAARQLSLVVATTAGDPQIEARRAEGLMNLGIEGLVVSGITHSAAFERCVARRALPVIATSFYAPTHALPTIGYDNGEIALKALTHLLELGHRKITVLHGPAQSNDRTQARLGALREHGLADLTFEPTELVYEAAAARAQQIAKAQPGVTALLCVSDVLALGALSGLHAVGFEVPRDMSVIGMEDLPAARTAVPGLTSIRLPLDEMGRAAGAALHGWIDTGVRPGSVKLPAELIVRQSTAKV